MTLIGARRRAGRVAVTCSFTSPRWPGLEPDEAMRAAAIDVVDELHERATAIAARHVDTQRASSILTV